MLILALALLLDWYAGDPDFLWKRLPHPVVMFGYVIDLFDRARGHFVKTGISQADPDQSGIVWGVVLLLTLLALCLAAAWIVDFLSVFLGPIWWLVEVAVVAVLIAQKSLWEHVSAVSNALKKEGLEQGRQAVSMIVGRDVSQLDRSGVAKAALESLAENFSDGVVAPAFWYAVFGLPGILFYKAVNTADSMIGHRNAKYEYFGKPAALLDDAMNWPAARISALLVVLVRAFREGFSKAGSIWSITVRDAPTHRSPNAGWPETAFAAALGVSLGGTRRYGDTVVNASLLNPSGRGDITPSDLVSGLFLFRSCCFALAGLCLFIWFVF